MRKFQSFKPSKKIKIDEENWKSLKSNDLEENAEELEYLSSFEKKCINGRFILDKRQEMTSKNTSVWLYNFFKILF